MVNAGIGGMDLVYPDRRDYYRYRPGNEGTKANQAETATPGTQPTLETQDPDAALAAEIAQTVKNQIIG